MIVAVTGGRDYEGNVEEILAQLDIDLLIHGGASGADKLAEAYCEANGIKTSCFKPNWKLYGRAAGPKRNAEMVAAKPDLCVAFPGGKGTANMIKLCNKAGVKVWQPYA